MFTAEGVRWWTSGWIDETESLLAQYSIFPQNDIWQFLLKKVFWWRGIKKGSKIGIGYKKINKNVNGSMHINYKQQFITNWPILPTLPV